MKRRTSVRAIVGALIVGGAVVRLVRPKPRRPTLRVVGSQCAPHVPRSTTVTRLLAPLAVAHVMLPFGFPGWDGITGLFRSIGQDVKDFVIAMISDAIDWAIAGVGIVVSAIEKTLKELRQLFDDFKGAIYSITDGIRGLAWSLWSDARSYADWAIRNAIAAINYVAAPLVDLAQLASGWITQAFQMSINWASENIYWPLWHKIEDAVSWVGSAFLAGVLAIVHTAIDIATAPFRTVWDYIAPLWSWFVNEASGAVKVVLMCWDFLIFVATHPLNWWLILLRDIAGRAPSWVFEHIAKAAGEHGSLIEDWAVKAIG